MNLSYLSINYYDLNLPMRQGSKIRGYFANKYPESILVHNHKNEKSMYRYPLIQYKIIDGIPVILGLNEGSKELIDMGILFESSIDIDGTEYNLDRTEIISKEIYFGTTDKILKYQFKTPWMALNAKNSEIYKNSDEIDREELLKRVLIGNIISMSKSLGYTIEEKLKVKINLKEVPVKFKNQNMVGFRGEFYINFDIPQYLGIGRNVSRGFGTVVKV
ncbi:CRISPR-associated endonuclease Cas6 [Methanococcus maripaludis]|jgi:hypothetical protein|uniref:CRISPR-associated endonuclease Cas6 n=4 Tax=Methanococcus maripaludis TaxID=39152 RepID=A0A8T3W1R1_METMI|nr:CRISPR-associated endonuclease Cas6 [Methanococcus maripaludis]MDK2928992.1 hypothetical protein [Methanococcus sp.]AEK19969.1 hypothetical protein GYY_05520 [Methanococcus maripaludis X1]MBG0768535.1 CRISPR-associated endonuclease Cas6 [Methanococcus maripaludis]BAP61176.1 hypothetical protein MMKA1_10590 [Methanococcus maripaludis KA1]BAP63122.1 hypothetical protein MMOS7_10360 [Methanococcus maripaludis OS7]